MHYCVQSQMLLIITIVSNSIIIAESSRNIKFKFNQVLTDIPVLMSKV